MKNKQIKSNKEVTNKPLACQVSEINMGLLNFCIIPICDII